MKSEELMPLKSVAPYFFFQGAFAGAIWGASDVSIQLYQMRTYGAVKPSFMLSRLPTNALQPSLRNWAVLSITHAAKDGFFVGGLLCTFKGSVAGLGELRGRHDGFNELFGAVASAAYVYLYERSYNSTSLFRIRNIGIGGIFLCGGAYLYGNITKAAATSLSSD
jgi:hypothetical protein